MNKQITAVLLCLTLLCACFAGCGQDRKPGETRHTAEPETRQTEHDTAEEEIPILDRAEIDWNTAFQTEGLPEGELAEDCIAFLKSEEDGSNTVLTVSKAELGEALPKRLPRPRYFEQFMDPAVAEELLPILDYALYRDCFQMCVPTARLSPDLVAAAEPFLTPTYYDTCRFSARGVCRFIQPDGQTLTFLLVSIDNYKDIRDRYRRVDGMNAANAFVDNFPEGLTEQEKLFRIYHWLTETVQLYHGTDSREEYFGRPTWSLLFDAMIGHVAVDVGYAETLSVICNLAGIDCFTVKSADHDWNIARIDGKYYRFDAARDQGLTPADFRYFGVSDETCRGYQNGNADAPLPFYAEYCPACREDLFPIRLDGDPDEDSPAAKISEYYALRNARNENPLLLFYRMGCYREEIGTEAPKDGWIRTQVEMEALRSLLGGVMTTEEAARFASGCLETRADGDARLSYRVPAEDPKLTRLTGLADNGDGTWTAQVLRFRSPAEFTPDQELVAVVRINGEWFVAGVE